MNFRSSMGAEHEGFQLAPLIDIVFLLLVFFVVTSALRQIEREMDLNVPLAKKGKVPERGHPPYYVNVLLNGDIVVHDRKRTYAQLKRWLADLREGYGGSPPPVVIRADRRTAFQHFVKVMDACLEAEIRNFSIANIEEARERQPARPATP